MRGVRLARAQVGRLRVRRAWLVYTALGLTSPWLLAAALWWSFLPFRVLFGVDALCVMGMR